MTSIRYIILGTGLVFGAMPHSVSAQQDWSRFTPPPVQVADLPQSITAHSEGSVDDPTRELRAPRSVLQTSHFETLGPTHASPEAGPWPREYLGPRESFAIPGPPPHRTIEAPRPPAARSRHGHLTGLPSHDVPTHPEARLPSGVHRHDSIAEVPGSGTAPHGMLHHGPILPHLPGVENDPKSVGPGHLGLGTHWIHERPSSHPPIPGATVSPRWKAPYSYGYFGAEGKRSWTRQYGYRDRYLQWSLR